MAFLPFKQKVLGSNPGRAKGVFFLAKKKLNKQALCLIKVRVLDATMARKHIFLMINNFKLITHEHEYETNTNTKIFIWTST